MKLLAQSFQAFHIRRPGARSERAFTLIELLIVVSIILILTTVVIPNYRASIIRAKEAVLKDDLYQLRSLIDQYTVDKQKAPQALDDLVTAGYIREIPKDPFTRSNQTWQVNFSDALSNVGQTESGIVDVHSGAPGTSLDGTPYSSW
ncbi:MAG: prepilin-type N-terminal cleavage/methylation domain-containing protein [Acidobacteriia bacterium]|nr:prepilin-type N-terminal cleavage/methylation domain-containing protein [Terriglobia bacterium]